MIVKTMQVGPIGTNCYLLGDEAAKVCAIIDPGGDAQAILSLIRQEGLQLSAILLTHGHYDHTGAVAQLRQMWPQVPVYLSRKDQYEAGTYAAELFPPIPGAVDYGEGDTIAVGGLTVEVLSTPGHSEGGVTLRCGDVLFCGDTLFAGSCGRTDFVGGSMTTLMDSLARLGRLTGNYRVLPGHMEPSDLDTERRMNPYLIQAMRK